MELERFLPVEKVAAVLGICKRGVYRIIASGDLRLVTIGEGARRVPESELMAYIERVKRERRR